MDVLDYPAEVHAFVELVRRYVALIDAGPGLDPDDFVSQAHRLLASLYAAALQLPSVAPDDYDISPDSRPSPMGAISEKLGGDIYYHEVFDPIYGSELVMGSLSDDLADTYVDLVEGLDEWDAGRRANAVWSWEFATRYHAGNHMVDALRALQRIVFDHGIPTESIEVRAKRR